MTGPKKRRQRRGEPLPDDAALIVRGDLLDPELLAQAARDNEAIYGFFGVSVFAEVGGATWEQIAATKLGRAEWIVLFTARAPARWRARAVGHRPGAPFRHRARRRRRARPPYPGV